MTSGGRLPEHIPVRPSGLCSAMCDHPDIVREQTHQAAVDSWREEREKQQKPETEEAMTWELKVAALVEAAAHRAAMGASEVATARVVSVRVARARRDAAVRYARYPAQATVDFYELCRELGLPDQ